MAAFVFHHKQELVQRLEQLNTEVDTSYALVFFDGELSQDAVVVMREAVRICDRVIVATTKDMSKLKGMEQALQKIGIDAVFQPPIDTRLCFLDAAVKDVDATFILQSILSVMPNLVVIHRKEMKLLRALRNIQQTFGELFTLRTITEKQKKEFLGLEV